MKGKKEQNEIIFFDRTKLTNDKQMIYILTIETKNGYNMLGESKSYNKLLKLALNNSCNKLKIVNLYNEVVAILN